MKKIYAQCHCEIVLFSYRNMRFDTKNVIVREHDITVIDCYDCSRICILISIATILIPYLCTKYFHTHCVQFSVFGVKKHR